MTFKNFMLKAVDLAKNATLYIGSELASKGMLYINKTYLDRIKKLNLDFNQRNIVNNAISLNDKALFVVSEINSISAKIKKIGMAETQDNIKSSNERRNLEQKLSEKEMVYSELKVNLKEAMDDVRSFASQMIEKK